MAAAFHGRVAKLSKLLEKDDPTLLDCPSVDYQDEVGNTPLHAACQEGQAECVELLLRVGAIVDRAGAGGVTPLILACESQQLDCVRLLLGAKAKPAARDTANGATALHGACQAGAADCVEALLGARAPVDAVDAAGATPLIVAAYGGHSRCVELLLAAGANDAAQYEGKAALELAEEAGHGECVRALEGRPDAAEAAAAKAAAMFLPPPSGEAEVDEDAEDEEAEAEEAEGMDGREGMGAKPAARDGASRLLEQVGKGLREAGVPGSELLDEKAQELDRIGVSLAEAERAKEAKATAAAADRPKSAAEAKARANALFAQGKLADASAGYQLALDLLAAEEGQPTDGPTDSEAGKLVSVGAAEPPARAVLHCNLAACLLRQRRWREAVGACDAACALHAHYTKALYRRAQARRALKEYGGAIADAAAAHAALSRAGGGAPIGESGRRTSVELDGFTEAVKAEAAKEERERARKEAEEFGLTLGAAAGNGDEKSVYYHYASQGEKTQDFMWWMRAQLRESLGHVEYEMSAERWRPSNGYPARRAAIRVSGFDPVESGDASRGQLEGTCTVRVAKGRRALFLDLSMEVPWRGVTDAGTEREHVLGGKTRLWGITHFNELHEWRHLNHRNTNETGPATDAIAEMLAPAMAAKLKVEVQRVIGSLLADRIDPAALLPPPKPKPSSRSWGRGTVDYSKWDALDDDDEEHEDRVVELL